MALQAAEIPVAQRLKFPYSTPPTPPPLLVRAMSILPVILLSGYVYAKNASHLQYIKALASCHVLDSD